LLQNSAHMFLWCVSYMS